LYIIEGIITIVFAFVCYFLIPKSYATAYFFTDEDKAVQKQRLELMEAYSGGDGKYTRKDVKNALLDLKTWLHGINQILMSTIIYGQQLNVPFAKYVGANKTDRFWNFPSYHPAGRFQLLDQEITVLCHSRYFNRSYFLPSADALLQFKSSAQSAIFSSPFSPTDIKLDLCHSCAQHHLEWPAMRSCSQSNTRVSGTVRRTSSPRAATSSLARALLGTG
jgi:hypothetical protein